MKEVWKDIETYEGLYKISNMGRVKSLPRRYVRTERIMSFEKTFKGYLRVILTKDMKPRKILVHVLVAKHFVVNSFNKPQVNHIDEDKSNNIYTNLEWCTSKENSNHGTRTQRQSETLRNGKNSVLISQFDLNGNHIKDWPSTQEAARNGYTQCLVSACLRGKQKQHKGYVWKYTVSNR